MGSFSGTCEIVESKEELNPAQHSRSIRQLNSVLRVNDKDQKPVLELGCNNSLEDDLNKLFEAINLKTSFEGICLSHQAGTSPYRKNALKKPMRAGMSHSSGIGISEPVTLKQALRGLCISQASEMAAMKRMPKSVGSLGVSDAGRIKNLYRTVVVEPGNSGISLDEGKKGIVEISLVPEESSSNFSEKISQHLPVSKINSPNKSVTSSPRFAVATTQTENVAIPMPNEIVPVSTDIGNQTSKTELVQKLKHTSIPSPCGPSSSGSILEPCKNFTASNRLANKASATKSAQKGRLPIPTSSCLINGNKVRKPTRSSRRLAKSVLRNKNFVKKKLEHDLTSATYSTNVYNEVTSDLDPSTSQLVCQRCQCTLKNVRVEPSQNSVTANCVSAEINSVNVDFNESQQNIPSNRCTRSRDVDVKPNKIAKSRGKGEISQSSKSSQGEYSSSTSISEESNLSGSSCGNRPHMSKDVRWEAIHQYRLKHGALGLGDFNLLKKLGFGDIGTVYLAELSGTNCPFAIKVMDNEYLMRRKKMPRAQTEREILRMLDHPFLPTLYSHFTSNNLSCLVMEYCPGGDLHVLRQKQPDRKFSEQAARFYVAEVLLALEYLHMLGVVYRDLKPENILVREDGHIMLTDFDLSLRCTVSPTLLKSPSLSLESTRMMSGPCTGSSCIDPLCIEPSCQVPCFSPRFLPAASGRKLKTDLAAQVRSLPQLVAEPTDARSNSFVGTHEYLAPEIIKGEGHGSAVDWWTFGIFLYELLYGKTPFKGSGNEETLCNVVSQCLKFPDSPLVSFQARDLIRGLLVKEPEHRFGSERGAAEIKQHLFFEGMNWALIRCAIPPELPEFCDFGPLTLASQQTGAKFLEYRATGEHLEFELF